MTYPQTPADLVCEDSRQYLEAYVSLHDGPQRVEQVFIDADKAEYSSPADLMKLLMLAHAAMLLYELPEVGTFRAWYKDKSRSLLLKAVDLAATLQRPAVVN
ncbi:MULTISPECIES: hypothetical protein [Mesorhizobium]|uniref:Uncharacterized protein n=1 Tax=Mesorhizobium denitrificans TaxID=2294114 RepID=A0A371X1Y6_9HYPH|nr:MULTISPECIES: hypothetical protein [Mesorhizobium]RFC63217.1 hypothetical protein DY251_21110 [Mesorhizobium denitrificans]